jgi:hypothetical protein
MTGYIVAVLHLIKGSQAVVKDCIFERIGKY